MATDRNAPLWVTVLLALVGVVLLVIAIVYFAEPAKSLPSFFPGHEAAVTRHHTKHAVAAVLVVGDYGARRPLAVVDPRAVRRAEEAGGAVGVVGTQRCGF